MTDVTVGQTIGVDVGNWANEPVSYTYQWYINDEPMVGETNETLLVPASYNSKLTVGVKGINEAGSSEEVYTEEVTIISDYIPELQRIIAQMDEVPSEDIIEQMELTILSLKSYNIWDKLDTLYVSLNGEINANLNWISDRFNRTSHGIVNYIPYRGFDGSTGTNFYLDTHYNPDGSNQTKYTMNSAMIGAVMQNAKTTANTNKYLWGARNASNSRQTRLAQNQGTGTLNVCSIHSSATRVFGGSTALNYHLTATRTGSTLTTYRNGVSIDTTTNLPPVSLPVINQSLVNYAVRNEDGSVGFYSNIIASAHYSGAYLTAEEVNNLYYTLNEFLSYIGAEDRVYRPQASALIQISPLNINQNDLVSYNLSLVEGVYTGSIDVEAGELDDSNFNQSFVSSLQTAVNAATGVTFDGIKTLSFNETFSGSLTWSRTLTSSPSVGTPHSVNISNATTHSLRKPYSSCLIGTPAKIIAPKLLGVNLAGAEFDGFAFYQTAATVDYYMARGFNLFRIPMNWQRLQPTLYGPLDTFSINSYKTAVLHALSRGAYVIIDPHDYAGRGVDGVKRKIGDPQLPVTSFIDWFDKLIDAIGPHDNLIYCLNNEPESIPQARWWSIAQCITEYIRAKGVFNCLQVPGTGFSTASSWVSNGNAARALNFKDPLNNYVFDVHQYLDPSNSGFSGVCAVNSSDRIDAALSWAASNNKTMFFGEFGSGYPEVSGQEQCGIEFPDLLDKIMNHPNSIGGTAWSGGPNWAGNYPLRLEPVNRDTNPDTSTLNIMKTFIND